MVKKKSVLVDLDGTLAVYDRWRGSDHFGDPIPGAVAFTHRLSEFARVVIFTTRCKATGEPGRSEPEALAARVKAWLDLHGFAYDEIYTGQGKPFAAAIVDDRAVECRPQEFPEAFDRAADRCRELCD